jgi:hypothetical protein
MHKMEQMIVKVENDKLRETERLEHELSLSQDILNAKSNLDRLNDDIANLQASRRR